VTSATSKISYLDGVRFKRGLLAAADKLIRHCDHLNTINVFPVPDGDTGTNMARTMRKVVSDIQDSSEQAVGDLCSRVADSALLGARGNSGIILAQFFCGLSEGTQGMGRITPEEFVNVVRKAANRSLEAISNPKDGTIVTVIQEWSEHLRQAVTREKDFFDLLQNSLARAKISLRETTNRLPSLKKAGVVDSGAQGFVYLLDGVVDFLNKGRLDLNWTRPSGISEEPEVHVSQEESLTTRFCTECLISGSDLDQNRLHRQLAPLGESLVLAGTSRTVRIHIHTNTPEQIFELVGRHGRIMQRKVEDMVHQHQEWIKSERNRVGIVTDSTCDLPQDFLDRYNIRVIPLTLSMDQEEYVDKVTITPEEFNRRLPLSRSVCTSQPSPGQFRETFATALAEHESLVSIHLSAAMSGTWQGAETASGIDPRRIRAVNSNLVSIGLGMVVLEAAKAAQKGATQDEVVTVARTAASRTRFFVGLDTLDYAVRGGRVSKGSGLVAKALHIKPILTFDHQGLTSRAGQGFGRARAARNLFELMHREARGMHNLRFAVAHVQAPEIAETYAREIEERFGIPPLYTTEASPVIGAYSGPRAAAIAFLGDNVAS
jgi:hypothetical protein